jgi:putative transcriptional regulator
MSIISIGIGSVLLSEPFLRNPLFERAVILLCHYDEDGAMGLILNKIAENPFEEEEDHPLFSFPFYTGGPVETDSMFFVHHLSDLPESEVIKDGVCWQGRYEDLLEAVKAKEFSKENCRLLVGYAGWEKGQLEGELEREDWMVYNGSIRNILKMPSETMWKDILAQMGPYYRMVSNFPLDPGLN